MKDKFIEFHINEHLDDIYSNAIIILDTNSLLNLYRYSKDTRTKYLEILSKVKDRLFITNQICKEFYKNRYKLIENQSEFKSIIIELIDNYYSKLLNIIKNSSNGGDGKFDPALTILKNEDLLRNEIVKEIEQSSKNLQKCIDSFEETIDMDFIKRQDPILAAVVDIFKDKVTTEISSDDLELIYKEGKDRYDKKIPPGYKDIDKSDRDRYGDLVIWNEIIRYAKSENKSILFVSDDRKEDWAIDYKGQDLGPRIELIKEFYSKTGMLFHSITTKEFIKFTTSKYSVKDTESLEKETETIHDKIRKEIINDEFISFDESRNKYFLRNPNSNTGHFSVDPSVSDRYISVKDGYQIFNPGTTDRLTVRDDRVTIDPSISGGIYTDKDGRLVLNTGKSERSGGITVRDGRVTIDPSITDGVYTDKDGRLVLNTGMTDRLDGIFIRDGRVTVEPSTSDGLYIDKDGRLVLNPSHSERLGEFSVRDGRVSINPSSTARIYTYKDGYPVFNSKNMEKSSENNIKDLDKEDLKDLLKSDKDITSRPKKKE